MVGIVFGRGENLHLMAQIFHALSPLVRALCAVVRMGSCHAASTAAIGASEIASRVDQRRRQRPPIKTGSDPLQGADQTVDKWRLYKYRSAHSGRVRYQLAVQLGHRCCQRSSPSNESLEGLDPYRRRPHRRQVPGHIV